MQFVQLMFSLTVSVCTCVCVYVPMHACVCVCVCEFVFTRVYMCTLLHTLSNRSCSCTHTLSPHFTLTPSPVVVIPQIQARADKDGTTFKEAMVRC